MSKRTQSLTDITPSAPNSSHKYLDVMSTSANAAGVYFQPKIQTAITWGNAAKMLMAGGLPEAAMNAIVAKYLACYAQIASFRTCSGMETTGDFASIMALVGPLWAGFKYATARLQRTPCCPFWHRLCHGSTFNVHAEVHCHTLQTYFLVWYGMGLVEYVLLEAAGLLVRLLRTQAPCLLVRLLMWTPVVVP